MPSYTQNQPSSEITDHRSRVWGAVKQGAIVPAAAHLGLTLDASVSMSTRDKWEHLVTDHRYSFAYFDGLNCFYVADAVSKLKDNAPG